MNKIGMISIIARMAMMDAQAQAESKKEIKKEKSSMRKKERIDKK